MFRKRKKQNTPQPEKKGRYKRHFSIPFLLAIPANFIVGIVGLISLLGLWDNHIFEKEIWAVFGTGFLGGISIVGSSKIYKFRTFIHELKHFIMVILTGNRVKNFHVDTHTGHVSYVMYSDKVHFAPLIVLAPYFLPIFSFPLLIVCLIFEQHNKIMLTLVYGFALATDLTLAYTELHPHQSDLKKVAGGFLTAGAYLAGFHFMWLMISLIWVLAGLGGYEYAMYVAFELAELAANRL